MALTPDQQLGDIINQLHGMTSDRLVEVVKAVEKITEKRQENRKKELWGNVVAAIKKYESEIDPVMILFPDINGCAYIDDLNHPGGIVITKKEN